MQCVLALAAEHVEELVDADVLAAALVAHQEEGSLPRGLRPQEGGEGGVGCVRVEEGPRRGHELGP